MKKQNLEPSDEALSDTADTPEEAMEAEESTESAEQDLDESAFVEEMVNEIDDSQSKVAETDDEIEDTSAVDEQPELEGDSAEQANVVDDFFQAKISSTIC
ncbi:hypothetical protein QW180_04010 [Vibrio sinaloensis]|nr:hypothetical protein [Vibrio sinaloensis]